MSKYQTLYETVKKSKNSCLAHARSYDDLAVVQLQPHQIKILLDNDKSLKKIAKEKQKRFDFPLSHKLAGKNFQQELQESENLNCLLQKSILKQELLMKKNLFDPYKYFGSSSHISSIQQSTRHHQSRLDAMLSYSDYNSPVNTQHNLSQTKKGKKQKNETNMKKPQRIRINISNKNSLSSKIDQSLKSALEQSDNNQILQSKQQSSVQQSRLKELSSKNLNSFKNCLYSPQRAVINSKKKSHEYKGLQKQSQLFSIKKSVGQSISSYRVGIGKSPKNYVKQNKQNYLKMNINNIQKVRLKLKLSKH